MRLDLAILGLLALFGLFGLFSGAIRQLAQLAGLVLAYLAAPRAAAALLPLAQKRVHWPPMLIGLAVSAAAFLLLATAGSILARLAILRLFRGHPNKKIDHGAGLVLGAGKGAAVVFAALSIVLFVFNPQTEPPGPITNLMAGSKAVAFVRKHNLFSLVRVPALDKISKLLTAAKNPETAKALADNPDFKALVNDPQFKAALSQVPAGQTPTLNNAAALMDNPRIRQLLQDPAFVKHLLKFEAAFANGAGANSSR
ncbi:MAG TPA: CvpA family protein [Elusimicrobiota bacterium]|nr:CvpA family protein [Elusimicrobiota bacterium]